MKMMIKAIALALAVCALSINAVAAPPKSAPSGRSSASAPSLEKTMKYLKGLSLYGLMNISDKVDADYSAQGRSASGTFASEHTFGIGAEYLVTRLDMGLGFTGGLGYEFSRNFSRFTTNGQEATLQPKPELQLINVYGQADLPVTDHVGIFAGLNYSFPTLRNANGATFNGKIGYQFGGSAYFTENFAVDAMYRIINMSGSAPATAETVAVTYDNARLAGFLARVRYLF